MSIPVKMRKLLPKGYSTFMPDRTASSLGGVSPRRAQIRSQATRSLEEQAIVMQRLAVRRMGRLPAIGDMVQVKIPDVDRSKLVPPCRTTVVVEVSNDNEMIAIILILCTMI